MTITAALRRFTVTTHVTSSIGWVGAVLVFIALAGIGLTSGDDRVVRGAYLLMAPAAWLVLVPLAHASLLTGLLLSLGTAWGLFRHYWVALKFAITAFATVIPLVYMGTFREMAGVAADPVVELGLVRNPSPLVHAILALVLLVVATVLAIYKPFGMTPYGRRQLAIGRSGGSATSGPTVSGTEGLGSAWAYLVPALAIILFLLLFLAHHFAGSALHH
jgi:uncharacterized membrane protein